jgi:hypothetical protein
MNTISTTILNILKTRNHQNLCILFLPILQLLQTPEFLHVLLQTAAPRHGAFSKGFHLHALTEAGASSIHIMEQPSTNLLFDLGFKTNPSPSKIMLLVAICWHTTK